MDHQPKTPLQTMLARQTSTWSHEDWTDFLDRFAARDPVAAVACVNEVQDSLDRYVHHSQMAEVKLLEGEADNHRMGQESWRPCTEYQPGQLRFTQSTKEIKQPQDSLSPTPTVTSTFKYPKDFESRSQSDFNSVSDSDSDSSNLVHLLYGIDLSTYLNEIRDICLEIRNSSSLSTTMKIQLNVLVLIASKMEWDGMEINRLYSLVSNHWILEERGKSSCILSD